MQKLMELKNKKGFTLIEMLIVILIIVILIAIAVPAVAAYRRDALRTQDEGAIETIRTAIESAMVRSRPSDNNTDGSLDEHSSSRLTAGGVSGGVLNYEKIVALSNDTTLDFDTREFYTLLGEYLGPNFQGNFKFQYNFGSTYASGSTSWYLYYVSYWRSDSATSDEAVMLYHHHFLNTNTALRDPAYLSEAIEIMEAHDPTDVGKFSDSNLELYRP